MNGSFDDLLGNIFCLFWRYLTRSGGLIWHYLSQIFIWPSICFSSLRKSHLNHGTNQY